MKEYIYQSVLFFQLPICSLFFKIYKCVYGSIISLLELF